LFQAINKSFKRKKDFYEKNSKTICGDFWFNSFYRLRGGGDNSQSTSTPTIAESFPPFTDLGLEPSNTSAERTYTDVKEKDANAFEDSLVKRGLARQDSGNYRASVTLNSILYEISVVITKISSTKKATIKLTIKKSNGNFPKEPESLFDDIFGSINSGISSISIIRCYIYNQLTNVINAYIAKIQTFGFTQTSTNVWQKIDSRNIIYRFIWNTDGSVKWEVDASNQNNGGNSGGNNSAGNNSGTGGGNNGASTTEKVFPVFGLTPNSASRNMQFTTSASYAERFEQSLANNGFIFKNDDYGGSYKKNVYPYIADAGVGDRGSYYHIALNLDNDGGDVPSDAFDRIFGVVDGKLYNDLLQQEFNGDHTNAIREYEDKLQEKGFNKPSGSPWEKVIGDTLYLWSGSVSNGRTNVMWWINGSGAATSGL
jgi:hypothetical protein